MHTALIFSGILGLCIGSFLNVIIARLPPLVFIEPTQTPPPCLLYALSYPRSHCPHCQHTIAWYDNIPLLSFLCLRARCRHCAAPIAWRYFLIEALTACCFMGVTWKYGLTESAAVYCVLTASLIALSAIDYEHEILPDQITGSVLWLGLLLSLIPIGPSPTQAILGAAIGYSVLWILAELYKMIRHEEGMGAGDFKLLALLGAWLGWSAILPIVLIASLLGTLFGLIWLWHTQNPRNTPMPFGPYLAFAGWISLFWKPQFLCLSLV
jgi:leader peptidase (prepilin peptidase)/N-methyltransferase